MRLLISMRQLIIFSLISAFVAGYIASGITMSVGASYEKSLEVIEVEVTGYSPSPHITDSTPFQMASGRIAKPSELEQLKYVALSRDLLKEYNVKWGDTVWISFEVQDKMGKKAEQGADVFFRSLDLAKKFGRQNRTVIIERR